MSGQNEGIVSTGDGNLQFSGDTRWTKGEVNIAATVEKKNQPDKTTPSSGLKNKGIVSNVEKKNQPGKTTPSSELKNKGIVSNGHNNVQAAGKTTMDDTKINVGYKGK